MHMYVYISNLLQLVPGHTRFEMQPPLPSVEHRSNFEAVLLVAYVLILVDEE
jgi:hypothetical protein